ncbi:MAG: Gfo/Idh/MocA family oxidoreductase [Ignavibacteriales bacterium]|nr:Gfo/Idh/MocA family oxidoreductase [Ignavibacteriales bacterium]
MDRLNHAIIGVGHLGKLHTKLTKDLPNCNLIGIFDADVEKAKLVSKEFNVPFLSSLEEISEKVDSVSIVSSTTSHYEIAKFFIGKNKHVFIEKPITATIEQAEELVELADEKKIKLQVGHIERFNPALISLDKYKLEPKFVQTDRLAQFNPRGADVAVVLDLMIHDIDIILTLIKSEVKNIYASGVPVVSDSIDIANARIEFENGAVANITASRISQKKMRKMRIFQQDAYISIDFNTGISEVFKLFDGKTDENSSFISLGEIGIGDKKRIIVYEQPEIRDINALQYEIQLFIDCVLKDTPPIVSGHDGLKALKVAELIINKIKETSK